MRYVVGAHVPNNDGTIADGLYVYGKYGLSFILTKAPQKSEKDDTMRVIVFDTIENAEKYAKDLRKAYRFEFKSRAKRGRFPMSAFRFYPLKFDSLNMKQFQLGKFIKETGNGKLYELYARSP